jgi:hypothetical protein
VESYVSWSTLGDVVVTFHVGLGMGFGQSGESEGEKNESEESRPHLLMIGIRFKRW